jgi:hypothetical protein
MNIPKFMAIGLGAAFTLIGCASGPKFQATEGSFPVLKPEQGRVYFYRSTSMLGAALQPTVVLDGVVVGKSQPGGFFYVDTNPGNHEVSTTTEVERKVSFVLDNSETKYVRTSVGMGVLVYRVMPELVGPDEARSEMANLSYTGTSIKAAGGKAVDASARVNTAQSGSAPGTIPYINAQGQANYQKFLHLPLPRAFVFSKNGHYAYSSGIIPGNASLPINPTDRALKLCKDAAGQECLVYMQDTNLIYQN